MYTTRSTGSLVLAPDEEKDSLHQNPNLLKFEEKYRAHEEDNSINIRQKVQTAVKKKWSKCNIKRTLRIYFPIIKTITTYNVKEYLPNDIIAGLTAGVMMIPQGMAFAALSTLPPIVGLYISFFASITYVFLGTGRQLSWGCIAILSLMMASILDKYDQSVIEDSGLACSNSSVLEANSTTPYYILDVTSTRGNGSGSDIDAVMKRRMEVASSVSVIVGLILVIASRIGLSRITVFLSDSLVTGLLVGVSFHVATSQFKSLLGISIPRYNGPGQLVRTWIAILQHIKETNFASLITSVICMPIIYLVKKFINERYKQKMRIPVPIELFVVIAATLVSNFCSLNQNYNVTIVGDVPIGVPAPKLPDVSLASDYIGDALVIVVLSYALSLAMAKTMGLKYNYPIYADQEMLACGLCTTVCGLFSGYITGASVSRSIVQDGAGGKTQVASIFSAGLVLLVIMVIGPYFYYLPKCVLSAIIVVNLRTMFMKLLDIPKEWRKSRYDCSVWVFTFYASIILNADIGLLAGVIFSLFLVVFRSMIGSIEEVGQIPTSAATVQLRSLSKYPSAQKLNNVKILQVKTPLYFVNSEIFTSTVLKKMSMSELLKHGREKIVFPSSSSTNYEPNITNGNVMDETHLSAKDNRMEKGELEHLFELRVVILDLSEVAFIDLMGVKALDLLIKQSERVDVAMLFANIPESLLPMLQSTGFLKKQGDRLFLTVEAALQSLAEAVVAEESIMSTPL